MLFKIKKGSNFSPLSFLQVLPFLWIDSLTKTVVFNSDCKHGDKEDWNRLFGFCSIHHTLDSASFGWLWNPITNKMDIASCCYIKGIPTYSKIVSVELNKTYTYTITNDWGSYGFSIVDEFKHTVCMFRKSKSWTLPFGYTLPLQFVGKTAQNDMSISF